MRNAVTAAIVAALVSSAGTLAASRYIITSASQIKPSVRAALRGAQGPTGERGELGLAGPTGPEGRQGATGPRGPGCGQNEEPHCIVGPTGSNGAEGRRGAPGFGFKFYPEWKTGVFYPSAAEPDEPQAIVRNAGREWICTFPNERGATAGAWCFNTEEPSKDKEEHWLVFAG